MNVREELENFENGPCFLGIATVCGLYELNEKLRGAPEHLTEEADWGRSRIESKRNILRCEQRASVSIVLVCTGDGGGSGDGLDQSAHKPVRSNCSRSIHASCRQSGLCRSHETFVTIMGVVTVTASWPMTA